MEFFVPKTQFVTLPSGRRHRLIRGIQEVPDAIADSKLGIDAGVKPMEQMTDAEWASIGRKKPDETTKIALDGAVRKVR